MLSRRALLISFMTSAALLSPVSAADRPLRLVYPYPAGGVGDAVLRTISEQLQKSLGRTVMVENVTGAGGRIGVRALKDAPADGSAVLFAAAAQFTFQPHALSQLGYDPFADFIPLSQVVTFDQALAVGAQLPAGSLAELAAWVKAHPEQASFGSPGTGTGAHFVGLEFAKALDLPLVHVPYRGTLAALPDLQTRRIPLYIGSSAELMAPHRRSDVRILATAGSSRSTFLPDVPTFRESGIDIDVPVWLGFYVKAGTAPDLVRDLEKAILAAIEVPDVRAKMSNLGFRPTGTTGKELSRIQRAEFDRWGVIFRHSGFKPE